MPRRSEAEHLTELGDFVTALQAKQNKQWSFYHLVLLWAVVALFSAFCHLDLQRVSYLPPRSIRLRETHRTLAPRRKRDA